MIPRSAATRVLVAGIGNIFLGDDGFGVEVVRRLAGRDWPDGVAVADFGIRGFDLAYALTSGLDAVLLIDATSGGEAPGSLYVIEPDVAAFERAEPRQLDAHAMEPEAVLRFAAGHGRLPARVLVLGCEPEDLGPEGEGKMGLSGRVTDAVTEAVAMVPELVAELLSTLDP